ncbi:MAG TPA: 4'-phosphopantetheinyl transferase superfamily protein [Desulfovibrio sp.]|uniref:4'-phosphopantetheinyl transferase family protein n=1 Tax=Desulfovibrio sp. TaxID=885 RepID=UPI002D2D1AD2|nr:4'-phosphopantetheinyl transferase superfamily protein [Desulfovibrio sp.]HZF60587.1 4'-phosphopantetheinyl transferase superfamily protein [Desulfovibrio sp.]
MERPLTILCTPLPAGSSKELEGWRCALEAVLEPWLNERQLAHVRRFGRPPEGQTEAREAQQDVLRAALSRLLARAQLVTHAARQARAANSPLAGPLPQLGMDTQGRPLFPGWHAAFSHSGEVAFCALCPEPADAAVAPHALDAESLLSPPPSPNAFTTAELARREARREAGLSPQGIHREALRRWTIKEALLKASGLGLGMDPARVPTGSFGQRAGIWHGARGVFYWRSLPCPGHWLSIAQQVSAKTDFPPEFLRLRVLCQDPTTLLRALSALRPRG